MATTCGLCAGPVFAQTPPPERPHRDLVRVEVGYLQRTIFDGAFRGFDGRIGMGGRGSFFRGHVFFGLARSSDDARLVLTEVPTGGVGELFFGRFFGGGSLGLTVGSLNLTGFSRRDSSVCGTLHVGVDLFENWPATPFVSVRGIMQTYGDAIPANGFGVSTGVRLP